MSIDRIKKHLKETPYMKRPYVLSLYIDEVNITEGKNTYYIGNYDTKVRILLPDEIAKLTKLANI